MADDLDDFPATVGGGDLDDVDDNVTGSSGDAGDMDALGLGFGFGDPTPIESTSSQPGNLFGADFSSDVAEIKAIETPASSSSGDDVFGLAGEEKEEISALAKWEEDRKVVLQKKAEKERLERQENVKKAKEELAQFYKKREDTLAKTKQTNRADEKALKADIASVTASGSDWEKVAKFCDLRVKAETQRNPLKTERMRSLLVGLKNGV